jgi:plastocyanin
MNERGADARRFLGGVAAALLMGAALACGGGSPSASPTAPSTTPVSTNTITITSGGVTPKDITVAAGSQVTFVNSDTHNHEMASDPHPEHTDCPEINQVGLLSPGQSRQSGNLNTKRICGYHDHQNPDNKAWQGTITIQ